DKRRLSCCWGRLIGQSACLRRVDARGRAPRLRRFALGTRAARPRDSKRHQPHARDSHDRARAAWQLTLSASLLTSVNVIQEVVLYWDASGGIDWRTYDYAPLYQYALGALCWSFGHVFFVAQIGNLTLAAVTTLCLCRAAWWVFGRLRAVIVAGLFAAYWTPLHHAAWYTQIENLYIPLFAASMLGLAFYLARQPPRLRPARARGGVGIRDAPGAPLVCRLDRARQHHTAAVLAALRRHGVLILHGPPHCPRYYGPLERQNREHRQWLAMQPAPTSLALIRF